MPELTPAFTVEDIHNLREWNYERHKDMTPEEERADIKRRADEFLKIIKGFSSELGAS